MLDLVMAQICIKVVSNSLLQSIQVNINNK